VKLSVYFRTDFALSISFAPQGKPSKHDFFQAANRKHTAWLAEEMRKLTEAWLDS